MSTIKFNYGQKLKALQGEIVTMTALLTINGRKFIEVAEADNWYLPDDLSELQDNHVIFEEIV